MENIPLIYTAIALSTLAGMSTMLGSILAFMPWRNSARFLAIALGFSAGVMLYISFVDLLPMGMEHLVEYYGASTGYWRALISFFAGILIVALFDVLIPHCTGGYGRGKKRHAQCKHSPIFRTGLYACIALTLHNIPEGFITLIGTMDNVHIGIALAIAIAIHNIPEGIAISIPVFAATGKRRSALFYTFIAGIAEPIGAILGIGMLHSCYSGLICGMAFCGVAGMMVYLSLDQMLPTARAQTDPHWAMSGFVAGMLIMAVSLGLLGA